MPSYQQIAGVLAAITKNANTDGGPLTPQTLIDTYCQPGMQSSWSNKETERSKFHAGFCGYDGQKGFDDGYHWLNDLEQSPHCKPNQGANAMNASHNTPPSQQLVLPAHRTVL